MGMYKLSKGRDHDLFVFVSLAQCLTHKNTVNLIRSIHLTEKIIQVYSAKLIFPGSGFRRVNNIANILAEIGPRKSTGNV